jgi:hypothetical protein
MTTQALIYDELHALDRERHLNWSIKAGDDCSFAREVNSVPLLAAEFAKAAENYPIIFAGTTESVLPCVVLGLQKNQNLFVTDDGKWDTDYLPAFIRRYPFVFSESPENSQFILCIDEDFSGCNQDGKGERLFDSEGQQTNYLEGVVKFLKDYQLSHQATTHFCKQLIELDLLEEVRATYTGPNAQPGVLTGFYAVKREKIKELADDKLVQMVKSDALELIYYHILSLGNFKSLAKRLPAEASGDAASGDAASGDAATGAAASAEADS